MRTSRIVSVAASAFVMQWTATSFAQPEAAPPPPAPAPAMAPATPMTPTTDPAMAPAPVAEPAPAPAPAPAPPPPAPAEPAPAEAVAPAAPPPVAAEAEQGDTDHNMMIGRVAFGYLGARTVSIASGGPSQLLLTPEAVNAPVVGIRYWISGVIGLDLGLGFSSTSGTQDNSIAGASQSVDEAGTTAVLLHAGVPLALAGSQHFSFQIVPEANVGMATRTVQNQATGVDTDLSGVHFDVGARVGAEVHWGFIGIPELSLQGSVGARLVVESITASSGPDDSTLTRVVFTTDSYNNPWDVLTSSVAALYYF